jgi:hypothetical protein
LRAATRSSSVATGTTGYSTSRGAGPNGPGNPASCEDEAVTLIAHAGHWLTTIAYFVPVVAFLAWLIVTQVRDRRSRSRS